MRWGVGSFEIPYPGGGSLGQRSGREPFGENQLPGAPQLTRGCGPAAWAPFVAPACARAPAAPPLLLHCRGPAAPGGGGIDLIFQLISMDTYARAARASIMRHLCSFIAKQKCLLIIGGRVGAGSARRGAGAAARGRAAAVNRREGRGDRARAACGGPRSGRGAPLFKLQVPGRPARPAWAGEHAELQGRVAPKTLGIDPGLQGSQLGGPVWSEPAARGTLSGLRRAPGVLADILK